MSCFQGLQEPSSLHAVGSEDTQVYIKTSYSDNHETVK